MKKPLSLLCCLTTASSLSAATLTGLWEFDDQTNLGKATVGTDLAITGDSPTWSTTLADDQSDSLSGVITTAAADQANQIIATHGIAANGGGSYVNQYSIVMDLFSPLGSRDSWRAIYQTNTGNGNDADYFISPADLLGVGAIGYTSGTIDDTSWSRLVITVDLSAGGAYETYLDGNPFFSHSNPGLDGRFALDPTVLFSSDENGDNAPLNIGTIAIYDGPLTASEVFSLGAAGAPVPEPSSLLLLSLTTFFGLRRRR